MTKITTKHENKNNNSLTMKMIKNSNIHSKMPLMDKTLVSALGFVVVFYMTITIHTFSYLPATPKIGSLPPSTITHVILRDSSTDSNNNSKMNNLNSDPLQNHNPNTKKEMINLADHTDFPQTIRSEAFEQIIHPASELSENPDKVEMSVPPFWNPSPFIPYGGVRTYLGNYGQNLMTLQQAQNIGSYFHDTTNNIKLETIFIAIASYRDFQCRQTIESIFNRAEYPKRIRVGVVDQYDPLHDTPCSVPENSCEEFPNQVLCLYQDQIDFFDMDASLAVGPVFARHIGYRMYRGEYFAVQSDAHVDFVVNWDSSMITQWKSANNEMAVLSAYLSDITGSIDPQTGLSNRNTRPIMCKSDFEGSGKKKHLRHGQQPEGEPGIHGEPTFEPFWAAGFSFARGHFVVNIPYDQHLPMIFQGEEISLGLRAFTYGYDFYTPEKSVCFHYYAAQDKTGARHKVKLFWENSSLYSGVEGKAMKRLNGILHMNPEVDASEWLHDDEMQYGLGKVRTTEKFFETFGIDIEKKTTQDHLCKFVGRNMQKIWKNHLRKDGMGVNYDEITYKFLDPDKYGVTWTKYQ